MALVTLSEAKEYLRVDSADEEAVIGTLLTTAEKLSADVARITEEQWEEINGDGNESSFCTSEELSRIRSVMKMAILYAVAYLFEHRENADFTDLTLTLRSLLFSIREGVV